MEPRPVTADPVAPILARRLGITKRYFRNRFELREEVVKETLDPGFGEIQGMTDYEDYLQRIIKEARDAAVRLIFDDEAEETDGESSSDMEDEVAPQSFDAYIDTLEGDDDDSECEYGSDMDGEQEETDRSVEEDHHQYGELLREHFGSDLDDD